MTQLRDAVNTFWLVFRISPFAIYNTEKGFFATDGMCTHEYEYLEEGLVVGMVIECPMHGGRFDISTGKALSAPVCEDLVTYPVKVEDGQVYIQL